MTRPWSTGLMGSLNLFPQTVDKLKRILCSLAHLSPKIVTPPTSLSCLTCSLKCFYKQPRVPQLKLALGRRQPIPLTATLSLIKYALLTWAGRDTHRGCPLCDGDLTLQGWSRAFFFYSPRSCHNVWHVVQCWKYCWLKTPHTRPGNLSWVESLRHNCGESRRGEMSEWVWGVFVEYVGIIRIWTAKVLYI